MILEKLRMTSRELVIAGAIVTGVSVVSLSRGGVASAGGDHAEPRPERADSIVREVHELRQLVEALVRVDCLEATPARWRTMNAAGIRCDELTPASAVQAGRPR
jgi:hypothetical protein